MVRLEKNDSEQTPSGLNPYLAARREWNERYGSYIASARRWRFMAFLSLVVAGIAVAGIVSIGTQHKVIPYVVEVDRLGRSAAVHYANHLQPADPRVIRALLARFIKDWRGVRVDAGAQKQAVLDLYALLSKSDPAATAISQYFQTDGNSPFERAKDETVAAEVVSVMSLTDQSWEIEWIEITRSRKGEVIGRQRWKAVTGIAINPPTDEATLLRNHIGMYVRELSWTKELGDPNEDLAGVRN
jgi:type IV secretion system protein VirB5